MLLKHKGVVYIIYIIAAALGVFAVAVLNNSSLAQSGYGLDLPMGWVQETVENTDNLPACGPYVVYSKDCFSYSCEMMEWKSVGLPLRTRKMGICREKTNSFAEVINLVIGAAAGLAIARIFVRRPAVEVE